MTSVVSYLERVSVSANRRISNIRHFEKTQVGNQVVITKWRISMSVQLYHCLLFIFIILYFNWSITLKYFERYHGQSEGNSAHSTINTAVKKTGNVYVPSQLVPIFKFARRNKPYDVLELQHSDFLDFKKLSKDLRILKAQESEGSSEKDIRWPAMMELRVIKRSPTTLYYKTSHLETSYKEIQLKRLNKDICIIQFAVDQLNPSKLKITEDKYLEWASLCTGPTPVIRMPEHKQFYLNLDH